LPSSSARASSDLLARKVIHDGPPQEPSLAPEGRIPRISRLMALAIRFDRLIKEGEITDQADLARLGNVTRARVTQIMNLLQLAPEIQEAILFLPRTVKGRDPIREHHLRPIAAEPDWRRQQRRWKGCSTQQSDGRQEDLANFGTNKSWS
jgi:hypothetical protein